MSLSFVATSSWSASASTSTASTPALPTGWQAGDLLLLSVHWKQVGATLTTPTGYSQVGSTFQSANGAGYAAGAGDTKSSVFIKRANTNETAPTIAALTGGSTANTTGNVMFACIAAFRATTTYYDCLERHQVQNTASLTWAGNMNSADNITNDITWATASFTVSAETVTAPSVTIVGTTQSAATVTPTIGSSTVGADLSAHSFYQTTTAGTASGGYVYNQTLGTSAYGTMIVVRIREVNGPAEPPIMVMQQSLTRAAFW